MYPILPGGSVPYDLHFGGEGGMDDPYAEMPGHVFQPGPYDILDPNPAMHSALYQQAHPEYPQFPLGQVVLEHIQAHAEAQQVLESPGLCPDPDITYQSSSDQVLDGYMYSDRVAAPDSQHAGPVLPTWDDSMPVIMDAPWGPPPAPGSIELPGNLPQAIPMDPPLITATDAPALPDQAGVQKPQHPQRAPGGEHIHPPLTYEYLNYQQGFYWCPLCLAAFVTLGALRFHAKDEHDKTIAVARELTPGNDLMIMYDDNEELYIVEGKLPSAIIPSNPPQKYSKAALDRLAIEMQLSAEQTS